MNINRFPEIAKAVGGQRGGKYLKRIPKPGGGYRYVYKEGGKEKPATRGIAEEIKSSIGKANKHIKNAVDTLMSGEEYAALNAKTSIGKAKSAMRKLGKIESQSISEVEKAKIRGARSSMSRRIEEIKGHIDEMEADER